MPLRSPRKWTSENWGEADMLRSTPNALFRGNRAYNATLELAF
jgi:hypothetical protein